MLKQVIRTSVAGGCFNTQQQKWGASPAGGAPFFWFFSALAAFLLRRGVGFGCEKAQLAFDLFPAVAVELLLQPGDGLSHAFLAKGKAPLLHILCLFHAPDTHPAPGGQLIAVTQDLVIELPPQVIVTGIRITREQMSPRGI